MQVSRSLFTLHILKNSLTLYIFSLTPSKYSLVLSNQLDSFLSFVTLRMFLEKENEHLFQNIQNEIRDYYFETEEALYFCIINLKIIPIHH